MKRFFTVVLALGFILNCGKGTNENNAHADSQKESDNLELTTDTQKASYSIGLDIGRNITQQGLELDTDALLSGISDALSGAEPKMSPEEIQTVMMQFQQEMQAKQAAAYEAQSADNMAKGEAFLAEVSSQESVVTLASGLRYKVIKEGTGASPRATDTVAVHYRGTLVDGTEFDSSFKRGQPATFQVDGVIKGWAEALQLMKVGGKWELYIPAELAYGERGAGQRIGPNETLIFEVELIKIQ